MIGIKDKYLIVSMNTDLDNNQQLLNILSDFEYKENSELHIILNETYKEEFIEKLVNVLGYISGLHYIDHFIKLFTSDMQLLNKLNEKRGLLSISGVESYLLYDTIEQKIVELDTRRVRVEDYIKVFDIKKEYYSVYDSNIYLPEIKILKLKGN